MIVFRAIGVCLLSLGLCHQVQAQEGWMQLRYQLQIEIRFPKHEICTPIWKKQLLKQVHQQLQSAMGSVVEVVVRDTAENNTQQAIWQEIDKKKLSAVLQKPSCTVGQKLHLVDLKFNERTLRFAHRQFDGATQSWQMHARDEAVVLQKYLARQLCLSLANDFGIVGKFRYSNPQQAEIQLLGGSIQQGLAAPGDLFMVLSMQQRRDPKSKTVTSISQPVEGVLLQAQAAAAENGLVRARILSRFRNAFGRNTSNAEYYCVKLGTLKTAMRLTLLDMDGKPLSVRDLNVCLGTENYPEKRTAKNSLELKENEFVTPEPVPPLVFLRIAVGERTIARVPFANTTRQVQSIRVKVDPGIEELTYAQGIAQDLVQRVRSARLLQVGAFEKLSQIQQKDRQKAIDLGQQTLDSSVAEARSVRAELARVRPRLGQEVAEMLDFAEADVVALEVKANELRDHLNKLKELQKLDNDPQVQEQRKQVEAALVQARLLLTKADVPAAIAQFELALMKVGAEEAAKMAIQAELKKLNDQWLIRDPQHAESRQLIYDQLPKMQEPAEVAAAIPALQRAITKCQEVNDRYTVLKFFLSGPEILDNYAKKLAALAQNAFDEDERARVVDLKAKAEQLQQLLTASGKYLGIQANQP